MVNVLNLASQATIIAVKPVAARRAGRNRLIASADNKEAGQTTEGTGENHGADDDLSNVDTRVARGVFAFADDGDFIALLGITQIAVHSNGQHDDDNQVNGITLTHDLREPACLALHVQFAQAGSLTAPDIDTAGDELNGNVVLIRVNSVSLDENLALNHAGIKPQTARRERPRRASRYTAASSAFSAVINHDCGGCQCTHQDLTFRADVPEAHSECRCQRDANQKQGREVAHCP